jgi:uncharacterized membrane-anchored protein
MAKTLSQQLQYAATKVPEATAIFWITKILTTGMGETASDFFVRSMSPFVAIALAGIVLAVSLVIQFSAKRYMPWAYWFAVIMVSVFGTMAADVLHVGLGIPYIVSTIFFFIVLLIVFAVWYLKEKTLSIHSIYTSRREVFYWLTVLTTFALGTAVGDMTATTLHLGYFASGILFAILILIPALAYWRFNLNEVAAFWIAYILTRPLGASFADWAGVSHARGGLALGTGSVSLVLLIIIVCFVGYLAMNHKNLKR